MESSAFLAIFTNINVVYALLSDIMIFHISFKLEHMLGGAIIVCVTLGLATWKVKFSSNL
jgi:drug/metabolite transporter (DMT)-like permease